MIQGQTVCLRAVQDSDVEPCWHFMNRADDWARVDVFAPVPREMAAERLREARRPFDETRCLDLVIETIADPRPVGLINVGPVHSIFRRAQVGVEIWSPIDRRHGYAREALELLVGLAFDWLNLHRLEATINADNTASLALLEKVGFQREGVLRDRVFHEGRYVAEVYLGLLRHDWRAAKVGP